MIMLKFPIKIPREVMAVYPDFDDIPEEDSMAVARYFAQQGKSTEGGALVNTKTGEIEFFSYSVAEAQYKLRCYNSFHEMCDMKGIMKFVPIYLKEDYNLIKAEMGAN
jgi:hypothetical protein